jgi:epoxyqueuosine reductase
MVSVGERITDKVIEIAESEGIPVLGMGPCAAMADEPQGYRPEDLLLHARSMICFGIPVPRGALGETPYTTETIWRSQNLYFRRLDTISLRLAQLLEESGAQAAPVFSCFPMAINGNGDVAGHVNQIRMAELTGIGTKGRNGLLLHSQFGARLMLGGVVTTADLPSLRMSETNEPGCPADCRICIDACPANAISKQTGRVDIMRCLRHTAQTPFMPRLRFIFSTRLNPKAAARLMNQKAYDEHTTHICSRCVTLCPYGEEVPHGTIADAAVL